MVHLRLEQKQILRTFQHQVKYTKQIISWCGALTIDTELNQKRKKKIGNKILSRSN